MKSIGAPSCIIMLSIALAGCWPSHDHFEFPVSFWKGGSSEESFQFIPKDRGNHRVMMVVDVEGRADDPRVRCVVGHPTPGGCSDRRADVEVVLKDQSGTIVAASYQFPRDSREVGPHILLSSICSYRLLPGQRYAMTSRVIDRTGVLSRYAVRFTVESDRKL